MIGGRVVEPLLARRGVVLQRGREAGRHGHQVADGDRAFLLFRRLGPPPQVIGDRIVEGQQPSLPRHPDENRNHALLHGSDVFDRVSVAVGSVAAVHVSARRGVQRPVPLRQDPPAVEDDHTGRVPFRSDGEGRLEPLGVPADRRRINRLPGPIGGGKYSACPPAGAASARASATDSDDDAGDSGPAQASRDDAAAAPLIARTSRALAMQHLLSGSARSGSSRSRTRAPPRSSPGTPPAPRRRTCADAPAPTPPCLRSPPRTSRRCWR